MQNRYGLNLIKLINLISLFLESDKKLEKKLGVKIQGDIQEKALEISENLERLESISLQSEKGNNSSGKLSPKKEDKLQRFQTL